MLTTGARHPYKIDEKYLRSRKVELRNLSSTGGVEEKGEDKEGGLAGTGTGTEGFDPRDVSGYKLKELIWTDWRSEWEARPVSPSSIRLILLGRLVEDKVALKGEQYHIHIHIHIHSHISVSCSFSCCWVPGCALANECAIV